MPSIVTRYYKNDNTQHFVDSFATDNYYFFIANILPWTDEPPIPTQSAEEIDFSVWDKIVAMKKITLADISFVIPRYDWESGQVYNKYKSYVDMFDGISSANTFYVINSNFRVYKCIDNNKEAISTSEPNQTDLVGTFQTPDGYEWKYMYPIVGSDIQKFISSNYIPISYVETLNNFNTEQYNIQLGAKPGTIDSVDVITTGNNYINFSSSAISSYTSSTVLYIDVPGANRVDDDYYNGCYLYVTRGAGAGQLVEIDDYDAATAKITLLTPLTTALSSTGDDISYVSIGPKITIKTDGDTQATAFANVNILTSNGVNYITMVNKGLGASQGVIIIEDGQFSGATGTGASARLNFSPLLGHGSNAVHELQNGALMFSVRLSRNEEEELLETENYSTYGILRSPTYANNTSITTDTIDNTVKLNLTNVSAALTNATSLSAWSVTGLTTLATANAIMFVSTTDGANGVLSVTNVNKVVGDDFAPGETIQLNSDVTYQGTLDSIDVSIAKPYSGEVIYIENREQILRNTSQIEDFKIIVQY